MEIQKHTLENEKLLYSDQRETNERPLQESELTSDRRHAVMLLLWKRMREYLGLSWVREYGEVEGEAFLAWSGALGAFDEKQIARGVKSVQDWTRDFPPTLPQFKSMCLTVRPEEKPNFTEQRIAGEAKLSKGVAGVIEHLAKHGLSDTAKHELDRMRRIFAGEDVETVEESLTNLGLNRRWQA